MNKKDSSKKPEDNKTFMDEQQGTVNQKKKSSGKKPKVSKTTVENSQPSPSLLSAELPVRSPNTPSKIDTKDKSKGKSKAKGNTKRHRKENTAERLPLRLEQPSLAENAKMNQDVIQQCLDLWESAPFNDMASLLKAYIKMAKSLSQESSDSSPSNSSAKSSSSLVNEFRELNEFMSETLIPEMTIRALNFVIPYITRVDIGDMVIDALFDRFLHQFCAEKMNPSYATYQSLEELLNRHADKLEEQRLSRLTDFICDQKILSPDIFLTSLLLRSMMHILKVIWKKEIPLLSAHQKKISDFIDNINRQLSGLKEEPRKRHKAQNKTEKDNEQEHWLEEIEKATKTIKTALSHGNISDERTPGERHLDWFIKGCDVILGLMDLAGQGYMAVGTMGASAPGLFRSALNWGISVKQCASDAYHYYSDNLPCCAAFTRWQQGFERIHDEKEKMSYIKGLKEDATREAEAPQNYGYHPVFLENVFGRLMNEYILKPGLQAAILELLHHYYLNTEQICDGELTAEKQAKERQRIRQYICCYLLQIDALECDGFMKYPNNSQLREANKQYIRQMSATDKLLYSPEHKKELALSDKFVKKIWFECYPGDGELYRWLKKKLEKENATLSELWFSKEGGPLRDLIDKDYQEEHIMSAWGQAMLQTLAAMIESQEAMLESNIMRYRSIFREALCEYYLQKERTPLLFKESGVSLEKILINPSIVKWNKKPKGDKEDVRDAEYIYIEPKELFKADASTGPINHLFVVGYAGIGKSTLCTYLSRQWAEGDLWCEEQNPNFEFVIWIRLRELATYAYSPRAEGHTCSIAEFLCEENGLKNILKNRNLDNKILEKLLSTSHGKTLYILDGYDEIAYLPNKIGNEHPVWPLINNLMGHSKWIMTSRPCSLPNFPIDRQMKIVGFTDKNIYKYIVKYFSSKDADKEKGKELHNYLKVNPVIMEIARIPIQLELMCFIWKSPEYRNQLEDTKYLTMSILYTLLNQHLFYRYLHDAERGAKRYFPWEGSEEYEVGDPWPPQFKVVIDAISQIALQGLVENPLSSISSNTIQEIRAKINNKIMQEIRSNIKNKLVTFDNIIEIGLLNRIGDNIEGPKKYEFLHQTFQEYYAALHISNVLLGVETWCLENYKDKKTRKNLYPTVQNFIRKHKYDMQYEVVWCFVSGLLAKHGKTKLLFDLIEYPPYDGLGLRQNVLSIRLLEECVTEKGDYGLPEEGYNKWVNSTNQYLYQIAFNSGQKLWYRMALQLMSAIRLSPRLVEEKVLLEPILRGISNGDIAIFVKFLSQNQVIFSVEIQGNILTQALKKENSGIRRTLLLALGHQAILHDSIFQKFIQTLGCEDYQVRKNITEGLCLQSKLSKTKVDILTKALLSDNTNVHMKQGIVPILGAQSVFSKSILKALGYCLRSAEDILVRKEAAKALRKETTLSPPIVKALIYAVFDEDKFLRVAAADTLGDQTQLSDDVVEELLSNDDWNVKVPVVTRVLSKQARRSPFIMQELIQCFSEEFGSMKIILAAVLCKQASPHAAAVDLLIEELSRDPRTVIEALDLGEPTSLPEPLVYALILMLKDKNKDLYATDMFPKIENIVVIALSKQTTLSEPIQKALIQNADKDMYMRIFLDVPALNQQNPLQRFILEDFIEVLGDKSLNSSLRYKVCKVLGQETSLPESALQALTLAMNDEDKLVRIYAANALRKQNNLPEFVFQLLIQMKANSDDIKKSIFYFLSTVYSINKLISHYRCSIKKDTLGIIATLIVQRCVQQAIPVYFDDKDELLSFEEGMAFCFKKDSDFDIYSDLISAFKEFHMQYRLPFMNFWISSLFTNQPIRACLEKSETLLDEKQRNSEGKIEQQDSAVRSNLERQNVVMFPDKEREGISEERKSYALSTSGSSSSAFFRSAFSEHVSELSVAREGPVSSGSQQAFFQPIASPIPPAKVDPVYGELPKPGEH